MNSSDLNGLAFLNTRPIHQSAQLTDLLSSYGADVFEVPMLEIVISNSTQAREAVSGLGSADWLVFTSVNGVRAYRDFGVRLPAGVRIAVIGPKTAHAAEAAGLAVEFVSSESNSRGFSKEFTPVLEKDSRQDGLVPRVLLLRGRIADPELRERLVQARVEVDEFAVYDSRPPETDSEQLEAALLAVEKSGGMVLVTSPEAFRNLVSVVGDAERLKRLQLAAIGSTTAGNVAELGFIPGVIPERPTSEELVRAIVKFYSLKRQVKL